MQVIRFAHKLLPHGSAFSVDFPEPRRLSPGMSATVKVVFRPPQRVAYSEHLELLSGATSIFVPLSASLPASKLELPPAVDFGCVPVRAACSRRLPITNVGDAPLAFSWQLAAPFAVVPAAGQLAPQQTLACEVLFQPAEAATYRGTAACSLDNGELLTVQVGGMAKFPCMQLAADTVDLGDVVVGQAAEAVVRLANTSAVPAAFRVAHADGCQDGTISLQPTRCAFMRAASLGQTVCCALLMVAAVRADRRRLGHHAEAGLTRSCACPPVFWPFCNAHTAARCCPRSGCCCA